MATLPVLLLPSPKSLATGASCSTPTSTSTGAAGPTCCTASTAPRVASRSAKREEYSRTQICSATFFFLKTLLYFDRKAVSGGVMLSAAPGWPTDTTSRWGGRTGLPAVSKRTIMLAKTKPSPSTLSSATHHY